MEWFIATDGTPGGTGAIDDPIDLATILTSSSVAGGDTVFLRGGRYSIPNRVFGPDGYFDITLQGDVGNPILIRPYGSERAIIDGGFSNKAGVDSPVDNVTIYKIEFAITENINDDVRYSPTIGSQGYSDLSPTRPWGGIDITYGSNLKIHACIIHACAQGMGIWGNVEDAEIYDCVICDNGWVADDRHHGHGIYTQNETPANRHGQWKRIKNNLMIGAWRNTMNVFTSSSLINLYEITDNIALVDDRSDAGEIYVGGFFEHDLIMRDNFCARSPDHRSGAGINMIFSNRTDVEWFDNYCIANFNNIGVPIGTNYTYDNNTLYNGWQDTVRTWGATDYPNVFTDDTHPTTPLVRIIPRLIDTEAANVVVVATNGETSYDLDVSSFLTNGDEYVLHDAEDLYGVPLASGTYAGELVTVPLAGTSNLSTFQNESRGMVLRKTMFNIDSRDKRGSAIAFQPNFMAPLPDGSVDTPDRWQITWVYRSLATPDLIASGTGRFESNAAGDIGRPRLLATGTGTFDTDAAGDLAGFLPTLIATGTGTFDTDAAGDLAGVLPTLIATGTGTFDTDAAGDLAGFLPTLIATGTGTFDTDAAGDLAGVLPTLIATGTGTFDTDAAGDLAGFLPTLIPSGTGTFSSNAGGMITEEGILNATGTGTFESDAAGDLTSVAPLTATGTGTFDTDAAGDIVGTTVLIASGTGTFSANSAGTLASQLFAAGTGTFETDASGRIAAPVPVGSDLGHIIIVKPAKIITIYE